MTPPTGRPCWRIRQIFRLQVVLLGLLAATLVEPTTIQASTLWSLQFENDAEWLGGSSDRYYTNGVRIGWTYDVSKETCGLGRLDLIQPKLSSAAPASCRYGYTVSQIMFTPADISADPPHSKDHPYGGWLAFGLVYQHVTSRWQQQTEYGLGFTGRFSGAGPTQRAVHRLVEADVPRGWGRQIGETVTFQIRSQANYLLKEDSVACFGRWIDLQPRTTLSLGTAMTYLSVGCGVRLGLNIPADFGPQEAIPTNMLSRTLATSGPGPNRPLGADSGCESECPWIYGFVAFDGRMTLHNLFLQGRFLSKSDPSVLMRPFRGSVEFGVSTGWKRVGLTYRRIQRTEDFRGQLAPEDYGNLTLQVRFCRC